MVDDLANPANRMRASHTIMKFTVLLLALLAVQLPAAETGGWRLAGQSSPYLQLHAGNPVQWYPWGEAAFDKARRENRPLFISIGYFTCHWCHVMARESFENPEIAALLNRYFVAIKVDREQRPDLDDAYMEYLLLTRRQGGWPMSVWATPDGMPFFAGSYFPPRDIPGYTGFATLLTRIAGLWEQDEPGIRKTAQQAVHGLRALQRPVTPVAQLDMQPVVKARTAYAASFDELQGGFGPAPKFPEPTRLLFLLGDSEPRSVSMALSTLDHILAGGIHDRLGGGFHRYATDFAWRVPHFEKMLYDQAMMARVCLAAWQQQRLPAYEQCVRATLDFTLSGLRDAQGGFHSALSADSRADAGGELQEGAGYTWTVAQLERAIPDPALRAWTQARYGIQPTGNAISDPRDEMQGRNVVWLALDEPAQAERFAVDAAIVHQRNRESDQQLRRARAARPAVPVDDKVVSAWNGYLVTALAQAGRELGEPRYLDAARQAAGFVLERLYDSDSGVLYRDWRRDVRGVAGFAEDYAALAEGLLALHAASGEQRWSLHARRLADYLIEHFYDAQQGAFCSTTDDSALWRRARPIQDDVVPSVNSILLHVLPDLARVSGEAKYRNMAIRTARWAAAQQADDPASMPYSLLTWPRLLAATQPAAGATAP